jgi:hypothetical protein
MLFCISANNEIMKKNQFTQSLVCTAVLAFSLSISQAQTKEPAINLTALAESIKHAPFIDKPGSSSLADLESLSPKVYRDFTRTFKSITDVVVTAAAHHTYIYCKTDGIDTRVSYDKKGNWHHTLQYYKESKLPKDTRHIIKSKYYDYKISSVVELSIGNKKAYVVTIEDERSYKTIKIVDDEIEVTEELQKS